MTAKAKKTDASRTVTNEADQLSGVRCELDGKWVHSVALHLKKYHPEVTAQEYRTKYPTAEMESPYVKSMRATRATVSDDPAPETVVAVAADVVPFRVPGSSARLPLWEVLGVPAGKEWRNSAGKEIMCDIMPEPDRELAGFLADTDLNYVFQAEIFKTILMGVVLNIPALLWGYHGTGKTTLIEQFCARTKRPWLRVQHTVSTEEAHILGQYVVKSVDGRSVTVFEPGPLAFAMKHGLIYCADEYDFALPSVTAVYQPVLEGKALIIKEAPPEWRMVHPHPNFRFFATGNTNGSGDETGLYQGTQIMNAANYSRFGITLQIHYMDAPVETEVVLKQARIHADDARQMVSFARQVRDAYAKGEISVTVSSRELIYAGKLGLAKGGDWRTGMDLAYINRLSTTDKKAVGEVAQRVFGGGRA